MSTATVERTRPETWRGDHGWRELAACAGMDTDLFYPEGRGLILRRAEQAAINVCDRCPVAEQCAAYAAERPERYGIFGGLTEEERGYGSHSERRKGKR